VSDDVYPTDGNDISSAPPSPAEAAQIAAMQTKLASMVGDGGGSKQQSVQHRPSLAQRDAAAREQRSQDARRERVVKVLTDARDRARAQEQQQTSADGEQQQGSMSAEAAEARRLEITKQLISGDLDDAEKQKLTAELRRLVAGQKTADEKQQDSERTVESRRAEHGVDEIQFISPAYKEAWSEENESEFYEFASQEGMESSLVQSLVHDYVSEAQMNDGRVTDEMVDAFHKKYAHRLSQEVRDKLVKWIRSGS
jgi:hypothetical protein